MEQHSFLKWQCGIQVIAQCSRWLRHHSASRKHWRQCIEFPFMTHKLCLRCADGRDSSTPLCLETTVTYLQRVGTRCEELGGYQGSQAPVNISSHLITMSSSFWSWCLWRQDLRFSTRNEGIYNRAREPSWLAFRGKEPYYSLSKHSADDWKAEKERSESGISSKEDTVQKILVIRTILNYWGP